MATICDVNWATGCGAMNSFFGKIGCLIKCNPIWTTIIGVVILLIIIGIIVLIKKK